MNTRKIFGPLTISVLALSLSACATQQENPNYQYSSKYQGTASVQQTTPTYANYSNITAQAQSANSGTPKMATTVSRTAAHHACLNRQTNRELLGAGIGGTVGAVLGKKVIGGTKGTLVGAGIGGAAGYGIGDKSIDCDTAPAASFGSASASTPAPVQSITEEEYNALYGTQNATYGTAVAAAPTDMDYVDTDVSGTPGYMAVQGGAISDPISGPVPTIAHGLPAPVQSAQSARNSAPVLGGGVAQIVDYDYSQNMISANAPAIAPAYEQTRQLNPSASAGRSGYVVQPGDTIYSLARKNCVGVTELQQMNNLDASFGIKIGQSLTLPTARC